MRQKPFLRQQNCGGQSHCEPLKTAVKASFSVPVVSMQEVCHSRPSGLRVDTVALRVIRGTGRTGRIPDAPGGGDTSSLIDRRDAPARGSATQTVSDFGPLTVVLGGLSTLLSDTDEAEFELRSIRRILERENRAVIAQQIADAQAAEVRSSPILEGVGLLPDTTVIKTNEVVMGTFFEDLGDVVVEKFKEELLGDTTTGFVEDGTVFVENGTTATGTNAALIARLLGKKTRKRRKRLLTCSDRDDITYMKSTLSGPDFKIWLGNPKAFARC